jgi:hypothetical protein
MKVCDYSIYYITFYHIGCSIAMKYYSHMWRFRMTRHLVLRIMLMIENHEWYNSLTIQCRGNMLSMHVRCRCFFLPLAGKIELIVESWSDGCDGHQDKQQDRHDDLYCFIPLECNTLRPIWVSIRFINLGELDRRAHNEGGGGLQDGEYLWEVVVL